MRTLATLIRRSHDPRFWISAGLLLTAAVLLAACGGASQQAEEAVPAPQMQEPDPVADDILAHPSRTEDDRYRDAGFKPLEVYGFFGVEPGMTVLDVMTGGGYNMHVLSLLVGDQGKVIAMPGPWYEDEESFGRPKARLEERVQAGNLANVEIRPWWAGLEDNSLDVIVTVRNYHDLGEAPDRIAVLPDWMRALKPGGVVGVVDAHTPSGLDEENHRIEEQLVIDEISGAGFELVGSSDILYNPDDTYDFDGREEDAPIHRYYIHRFVHRYSKAE